MNRFKNIRSLSIFWSLFIGIGALWGSIMMFTDPLGKFFGMYPLLPGFQKLPFSDIFFQNFIFPGIALLLVTGMTNLYFIFGILQAFTGYMYWKSEKEKINDK